MKTKLPLMALFGLVSVGAAVAARIEKPAATVEVTFVAPEKFTDVREDYTDNEKGRDALLSQIKEHLVSTAGRYLPADQRLEIKVTDVDLAGDFEPWHGPNFYDVRIVKEVYPPRVNLEFKLIGADGRVISEGKRQLRELGYLMAISLPRSDPLRHDKEMLTNWLRSEFRRPS